MASNVFAHTDQIKDIVDNVKKILAKKGVFIIEVQYLLRTLKDKTFDNIYHEHVNYWSLLSLEKFFTFNKMNYEKIKLMFLPNLNVYDYCINGFLHVLHGDGSLLKNQHYLVHKYRDLFVKTRCEFRIFM